MCACVFIFQIKSYMNDLLNPCAVYNFNTLNFTIIMQNNGEPSCVGLIVVDDKSHMTDTYKVDLYILPSKYRYKEKITKLSENELTS